MTRTRFASIRYSAVYFSNSVTGYESFLLVALDDVTRFSFCCIGCFQIFVRTLFYRFLLIFVGWLFRWGLFWFAVPIMLHVLFLATKIKTIRNSRMNARHADTSSCSANKVRIYRSCGTKRRTKGS